MNKKLEEENKQNEENHDKSIDNEKETDPRINFERINKLNQSRPQTSYGRLNIEEKIYKILYKIPNIKLKLTSL